MVIKTPSGARLNFSQNLIDFICVTKRLETDAFIPKLNAPSVFFVYCDLVDPDQNFLTGKKTTLLAKFDNKGEAFEKINYRVSIQQAFRAASTSEHVHSVMLSVKDEDGGLFDSRGQNLYFEL